MHREEFIHRAPAALERIVIVDLHIPARDDVRIPPLQTQPRRFLKVGVDVQQGDARNLSRRERLIEPATMEMQAPRNDTKRVQRMPHAARAADHLPVPVPRVGAGFLAKLLISLKTY